MSIKYKWNFQNSYIKCSKKAQSSVSTHAFSDVPSYSKIPQPLSKNHPKW